MSMPMPPPDTRAAGQQGHITDHNTISDALTWLSSSVGTLQAQAAMSSTMSPVAVQSGAFLAAPGLYYPVSLTGGPVTATLPSAPADGSKIGFKVVATSPQSQYALTVVTSGTDKLNSSSGGTSVTLTLLNQGATFQYSVGFGLWYITSDDLPLGGIRQIIPDWLNAKAYGAKGDGVTDDTASIQAALNAAAALGGGTVYLPWGAYLVSAPLRVPPYVTLAGTVRVSLNFFTTPPASLARVIIAPGFTPDSHSGGALGFYSQTPGAWSVSAAASGAHDLIIDGSQCSNSGVQGIAFVGPVYDTTLQDVFVWKAPHDGLIASGFTESGIGATFAYHQRYTRLGIVSCGFTGADLTNMTDTIAQQCLAFGNTGNGFNFANNSNSLVAGCKSEWNSGRGFDVTGSGGSLVFTGCSTDQNSSEGLRIHAASGQGTDGGGVIWTGGKLHGDGRGATNTSGVKVTGSTVPVIISGLNVEASSTSGSTYPIAAVSVDTSTDVTVTGCILQARTSPWSDGGGNTNIKRSACIGMTGSPGSQVTVGLPHLPSPLPWDAPDAGWLYQAFDMAACSGTSSMTSGTLYLTRVNIREACTITSLVWSQNNSASGITAGQNFIGLYSSAGTLLGQAALDSPMASSGAHALAMSGGPVAVAAGYVWVAMLVNATTTPSLFRGLSTAGNSNIGLTAAQSRWAVNGTGLTALPSSITPSSNSSSGTISAWNAVS